MDYKEKYEQALEDIKEIKDANKNNEELVHFIESHYPELKEDGDEIWIDRACMLLNELNHLSTLTLDKIPSNVDDIIDHLKSIKAKIKCTWNEEDEDYYDAIIAKLEVTQDDAGLTDIQMNFLKFLKEKVQPQSKQVWNEEDKLMINLMILDYESASKSFCGHKGKLDWLKSLRERWEGGSK